MRKPLSPEYLDPPAHRHTESAGACVAGNAERQRIIADVLPWECLLCRVQPCRPLLLAQDGWVFLCDACTGKVEFAVRRNLGRWLDHRIP